MTLLPGCNELPFLFSLFHVIPSFSSRNPSSPLPFVISQSLARLSSLLQLSYVTDATFSSSYTSLWHEGFLEGFRGIFFYLADFRVKMCGNLPVANLQSYITTVLPSPCSAPVTSMKSNRQADLRVDALVGFTIFIIKEGSSLGALVSALTDFTFWSNPQPIGHVHLRTWRDRLLQVFFGFDASSTLLIAITNKLPGCPLELPIVKRKQVKEGSLYTLIFWQNKGVKYSLKDEANKVQTSCLILQKTTDPEMSCRG